MLSATPTKRSKAFFLVILPPRPDSSPASHSAILANRAARTVISLNRDEVASKAVQEFALVLILLSRPQRGCRPTTGSPSPSHLPFFPSRNDINVSPAAAWSV